MNQSHTYSRKKNGGLNIDPDDYATYRNGVAFRIIRKSRGRYTHYEAWQLAAIPAFFLWAFRGPIHFFMKRKADRKLRRKLESNRNPRSTK